MPIAPYLVVAALQVAQLVSAPHLNIEPSCRASSRLDLADGQSFATCMRDETDARDELGKKWESYPVAPRSRCTAEVMIGGDPSYVELLECLEMDKEASHTETTNR